MLNYLNSQNKLFNISLISYLNSKFNYSSCQTKSSSKKAKWKSVVGLEIHAQIATKSKLFSGAGIDFNSPINNSVSLFDAAIPGTLPVLNRNCVEFGIKTALALSCKINPISMFDRKHYFYADLPAGYQITQQRAPLANNGLLQFPVHVPGVTKKPYIKTVRLHQLQLEQDSGKSLHDHEEKKSFVDLNRAGVPLMELVFEPDLENGEEAAALVKELILILTRLQTCSCKMEEGALRIDANVSVHEEGTPLGTRTEIKNIGSVRGVANAITHEIDRQIKLCDSGIKIQNETRSWDAIGKQTIAMRDKEVVQDYRFMPEPNLPPLFLNVNQENSHIPNLIDVNVIHKQIPELPEDTRKNLMENFGLTHEIAIILVRDDNLLNLFLKTIEINPNISPKKITNLIINDLLTLCHKHKIQIEDCKIKPHYFAELLNMLQDEIINIHLTKLILQEMILNVEISPIDIANKNNWKQIKDETIILTLCQKVIETNSKAVANYRMGKEKVLYALAGEIFKLSEQKVNMEKVINKLKELLK